MTNFDITHEWLASGHDAPEIKQTMAWLAIQVGNVKLTQNEDIWSRTVRDSVLVSAYPIAMWFASSWWRLLWEPLPLQNTAPSVAWRMAHELGAASAGFVWPQIAFASDRELMQIWAASSKEQGQQSVRYINGLAAPQTVMLSEFQNKVTSFIDSVLARLEAVGIQDSNLAGLWDEVRQEILDPDASFVRRMEAEMGYEPDECPDNIMAEARALSEKMGAATLSELLPLYGNSVTAQPLTGIVELIESNGLIGKLDIPDLGKPKRGASALPWQRAVEDARNIRAKMAIKDKMGNADLCGLLGLRTDEVENYSPCKRKAAMAVPVAGAKTKLLLRKSHPTSRRFELARFVAAARNNANADNPWLASTDLNTSIQKYQRAFAAEFLCPINQLTAYLDDDYSDSAIEDAASHFEVSERTVHSLLLNNDIISLPFGDRSELPYGVACW